MDTEATAMARPIEQLDARSSPMSDLYARLTEVGFPRSYVRGWVLPDWWEDELAADLDNLRLAEMTIARTLKIPLTRLAETGAPLSLDDAGAVRFKRWQDAVGQNFVPAVVIARRVCELLLTAAVDLPELALGRCAAAQIRQQVLVTEPYVTLTPLVQACWGFGVPVVHIKKFPSGSRRLDGMALVVSGRPCLVLASGKQSPAWLVWHLAHELGHAAQGHLESGDAIDVEIDFSAESLEEREANQFAKSLVYGSVSGFTSSRVLTAPELVSQAIELGPQHRIHPACIVTSYGFNMKAWEVANAALKLMHLGQGGPQPVRSALRSRLDLNRLPETDRHFFAGVTGLAE